MDASDHLAEGLGEAMAGNVGGLPVPLGIAALWQFILAIFGGHAQEIRRWWSVRT
jgi:hypothetical protein